jgi:glutathione S-transferase
MAPHVLLEELGVPYELTRVELGKPRDEAYLKLNPWGRVPTLVTDGKAIFESAAICLHLTDRHPDKGLAPAVGTMERATFYQWLLFLADTLQPAFMRIYRSSRFSDDPAHEPAVKDKARTTSRRYGRHSIVPSPGRLGSQAIASVLRTFISTCCSHGMRIWRL